MIVIAQLLDAKKLTEIALQSVSLAFLFVSPKFIQQGFGKQLIAHAIDYSRRNKYDLLKVLSDPNAVGFYKKYGCKVISQKQSSIPGRFLPEMELSLI